MSPQNNKTISKTVFMLVLLACMPALVVAGTPSDFALVPQIGHRECKQAFFTSDSARLVSLGDNQVKVWNVGTGQLLASYFLKDQLFYKDYTLSGDDRYLYFSTGSNLSRMDLGNGKTIKVLEYPDWHGNYTSFALAADSKSVFVIQTVDGVAGLNIHDLRNGGKMVRRFAEGQNWWKVAATRDLSILVAMGDNGTMSTFAGRDGRQLATTVADPSGSIVQSAVISNDGRFVSCPSLTAGVDQVWTLPDLKPVLSVPREKYLGKDLQRIFSPDGRYFMVAQSSWAGDSIDLYDLQNQGAKQTIYLNDKLPGGIKSQLDSLAISPDGRTLAGYSSGILFYGILPLDKKGGIQDLTFKSRIKAHDIDYFKKLLVHPDGRHVLMVPGSLSRAGDGSGGRLYVWDLQDFCLKQVWHEAEYISSVAVSGDGNRLAMAFFDVKRGSIIRLSNYSPGGIRLFEHGSSLDLKDLDVQDMALDRTGKYLYLIGVPHMDAPGKEQIRVLAMGDQGFEELSRLELGEVNGFNGPPHLTHSIAVSPDGAYMAYTDGFKKAWACRLDQGIPDAKSLTFLDPTPGPGRECADVAFSPDSAWLATGAVRIFVTGSWKPAAAATIPLDHANQYVVASCSTALSFSPDGKTICAANLDNWSSALHTWSFDGKTLNKTGYFAGHAGNINDAIFLPGGKLVMSCGSDTAIRLNDPREREQVAIWFNREGEWLFHDSSGIFDASRKGGPLIAMVKDFAGYGVDQFALLYNRPDLVMQQFGFGLPEQRDYLYRTFLKRASKAGYTEKSLGKELHVPVARIGLIRQEGSKVYMEASFEDTRYPLKYWNIFINDVPVYGIMGKSLAKPLKSLSIKESLELLPGDNKIEVSCFNDKGAESWRASGSVFVDTKPSGDLYFLGFGVSDYQDPGITDLNYAHKDTLALGSAFGSMNGDYSRIHVKTLTNQEVTTKAIRQAEEFLSAARPEDTVVLFLAGHGVHDTDKDATYYFLTHDTDLADLPKTAADFSLLEGLLERTRAQRKLFLIDTCESGEMDSTLQSEYATLETNTGFKARSIKSARGMANNSAKKARPWLGNTDRFIYNNLSRRTGAIIFTACRGGELSWESDELGHGFFTWEIIAALKGGIKPTQGIIWMNDLRQRVSEAVAKRSGGIQNPLVERDNLAIRLGFPPVP